MAGNAGRLLIVASLLGTIAPLDLAAAAEGDDAGISAELVAREKFIKSQFVTLKTRMLELADMLDKTEPDSARILRQTVSQAQKAYIAEEMEKVSRLLAGGLASVAARTKSDIVEDLRKILRTLRYGLIDIDRRLERIARWKKLLAGIREMIERQKALERDSRLSSRKDDVAKRMAELARRMAAVISKQKKLLAGTLALDDLDPRARRLARLRDRVRELIAQQDRVIESVARTPVARLALPAAVQKALADRTDGVRRQADAQAKAVAEVSKRLAQAAGEMRKANDALLQSSVSGARDPQIQARADLKAAEKAMTDAIGRIAAATPAGKLSDRQSALAGRTEQLARDVRAAASRSGVQSKAADLSAASSQMRRASDRLAGQDAKAAAENQKKALAELEKKEDALAVLRRRILAVTKKPVDRQASEQKNLAADAEKTSREMKSDQPSPTPGQGSMQKASGSMGKAAGQLGGGQSSRANSSQNRALDELRRARDELAEQLNRQERIAQAETLARIDRMLDEMLKTQRTVTARTSKVYDLRTDGGYGRPEQLALSGLADGEGKLAADAEKILKMLRKEGSTVVFPTVLREVQRDLQQAQGLLAERDAGLLTQDVQRGIERNLQEMIDALRRELARRRRKGGGGGVGGGGGGGGKGKKPPLVPPVAELKMLRSLEIMIRGRTALLARQKAEGRMSGDKLAREHKRLAGRQDKVRTMTENVAKNMRNKRRR